ncbi:hypothetical protein EV187_2415 [Agromyces ramosus]|jgi:hypothetical protein|uniref:Large exoprotein n=1 Tax=Agromyces ramosus TaxID=33879 RepID=A0A4Q7M8V0_9MICO|nr:hypothetical protein [Agromyces ramosus]RZS64041.1 hypothetical protein EV187_2415 [Agromyces ramosus]
MDVIGGGVLVAAAAALWIAYLLPSWLRRRQYLDTERNAVRLQQTLRILAETAETPEAVRVEATAREVASQQRILHEHELAARLAAEAAEHLAIAERRAAEEAAEAARQLAAAAQETITEPIATIPATATAMAFEAAPASSPQPAPVGVTAADVARRRRSLRRRRGLCSLLLLASLLTAVGGVVAAAFGASPYIAGGGALGIVVAFAGLVRLARVRIASPVAVPVAVPESVPFEPIDLPEAEDEAHEWTPQPLPKPLHLSRGTIAAAAMASIEAAEQLRRVAADAELARRVEELEPQVATIERRPLRQPDAPAASARREQAAEPASPYARMGIVDDASPAFDDLDAVLRRRRQAG